MKDKILEVCQEYFAVQKKMKEFGIESIYTTKRTGFHTELYLSEFNEIYLDVETYKKIFPNSKGRTYFTSSRCDYEEKYKNVTFKATNGKSMGSFNPI